MSSPESNPRVAGIDVSQQWLDVHLLPEGDENRFSNDVAGFQKLGRKLKSHPPRVIVLEGSGGLERGVATYLAQEELPVAIVNPRQVRDFAKASGRLAKTDALDAQIIARFGEALNIQPRFIPDLQRQELRALVSRREQLVGMLKAEKSGCNGLTTSRCGSAIIT